MLSHYHADHIYGLQAFRDYTDTIIIAQDRAREYKEENEETADERSTRRLDQRRQALAPWVNENTRVVPPDITFNDRMTLTLGDRRFQTDLRRPRALGERHDDDGRAGRRIVCRRHRAERPHPVHEQRRRRHQAVARRACR